MRILFDTSMLYIDSAGKRGIYYFTLNFLKHLLRSGEATVIQYPITKYAGLKDATHVLPNLAKLLDKLNVDLIYIPHPRAITHAIVSLLVSKPVNVTIHDVWFLATPTKSLTRLVVMPRYAILRTATQTREDVVVTTISAFSKWAISHYLMINPNKVTIIYQGIDEIFKPINKEYARKYVAEKYGITTEFFIYSGAISLAKGVGDLIRAFKIAHNRGLRASLVLTGPLQDELIEDIRGLHYIRYLGHVPRHEMPILFSASIGFVFPSYHEGFGLPPLEAAACGVPVIVSRIPPFLETLGNAAIFVKPGDIAQLSEVMLALAKDESLRDELGRRALDRARLFTWDRTVKHYLNLWRKMIKVGELK